MGVVKRFFNKLLGRKEIIPVKVKEEKPKLITSGYSSKNRYKGMYTSRNERKTLESSYFGNFSTVKHL